MPNKVNLDAMIRREDFLVKEDSNTDRPKTSMIKIVDLIEGAGWYSVLRKPLFQRITDEWDPKRICDFIVSFVDGDFIPPLIMWPSEGGFNFVIDGSHRLGSLIAWTHDDYGDKTISQDFYGMEITQDQLKEGERTRQLIKRTIGSYEELQQINQTNDSGDATKLRRARRLQSAQLDILNVIGPAEKAESSFIKINDSAAKINNTERDLIKTRDNPNSIAARAIIRAGTGHKYWSSFETPKKEVIEKLAKQIYDALFRPPYESPVYTTDLPFAGKAFSGQSLSLVRDIVNIINKIPNTEKRKRGNGKSTLPTEGFAANATLKYLQECLRVLQLINDRKNGQSLGIHPTFYVYTADGRLKPASVYAVVNWVIEMEQKGLFGEFIKVRQRFEDALEQYDYLVQQIVRSYRSAYRSYPFVTDFYLKLMKELADETDIAVAVEKAVRAMDIGLSMKQPEKQGKSTKKKYDRNTKSEIFLDAAKKNVIECAYCHGRLHRNAITIDHDTRIRDGGLATADNGQPMHPYCNTLAKN